MPSRDQTNSKVIRISKDSYNRIKAIKGKQAMTSFISSALDTIEMLAEREPIFIVQNECFSDIKEARGKAILEAAKTRKSNLDLPYIAVILGQDTGE